MKLDASEVQALDKVHKDKGMKRFVYPVSKVRRKTLARSQRTRAHIGSVSSLQPLPS